MESKKYPAVAIAPGVTTCAAAKALNGRRYLAIEAPPLPLPDCSQPHECRCRFSKFPDRRDDEDERRHLSVSMRSVLFAGQERRRLRGRRRTD